MRTMPIGLWLVALPSSTIRAWPPGATAFDIFGIGDRCNSGAEIRVDSSRARRAGGTNGHAVVSASHPGPRAKGGIGCGYPASPRDLTSKTTRLP